MKSPAKLICVLTTIQQPTISVERLVDAIERAGASLVVIGDRKGPASFECIAAGFLSIEQQRGLSFRIASLLPENHYARKNLGYLVAMQSGAECVYETDDDNMPLPAWRPRDLNAVAEPVEARPWANVYRLYAPNDLIWPRGFPLNLVNDESTYRHSDGAKGAEVRAPIQQGLADGSPDVDAVWRLLFDREYEFGDRPSVVLPAGTWCPFNSQSTWWWPVVYPLMYLPSYCSFRMTDIWRSFIAQRCLWELGHGVVFHTSEVLQERNAHDLMRDFQDEIPGYLRNEEIARLLTASKLESGVDAVGDNLRRCYATMADAAIISPEELPLVDAWLADVRVATGS